MAKFTHLLRPRRTNSSPLHPPKAEDSNPNIVGGVSEQHQASEIADAEFLISRVSGSCAAKAAYVTRGEVSTYLRQGGFPGTPYACQFCGFWHVTTMTKKAQKTLRRKIRAAQKILNPSASFQ